MFEVVVEYFDTTFELGVFDTYEDAYEAGIQAMDEPGACFYIYKNGVLY